MSVLNFLDAAVADIVYKRYPNKREGFLTNTRSKIVQRETMNKVAVQLGLDQMVVYSTKINSHNNHMYGNALEALIGAIYLDQGYDVCYKFIRDVMIEKYIDVDTLVRKEINFKSNLIEWSQKNKISISFDLIESFTDHDGNPVFQSAIKLLGEQIPKKNPSKRLLKWRSKDCGQTKNSSNVSLPQRKRRLVN